jgi:hypothetical protein
MFGYYTVLVKPNDETWITNRKVNDSEDDSPIVKQKTDNFQTKVIQVVCAKFADIVRIKRNLQDSEWRFNLSDGTQPIQEGLDLFKGPITCQRFLRLDERDDGEYLADAEL